MRISNYFLGALAALTFASCHKQEMATPTSQRTVGKTGKTLSITSYPSYNTSPLPPDQTGVTSTATQLAAKFQIGWNIGNTLEASGGETNWGNPMVTQALIDEVKNAGFTAVRIPCDWDQYADQNTAQIQQSWLNRVQQVVQYCVNDGLYVVLNIHWDDGWLTHNCTTAAQASVNAKQKAFWEQIATQMRGFDEHVIFASTNEPEVTDATGMSVLLSYHQTFVNAVRSTGGHNSYRVLLVQGPGGADISTTNNLMNTLPTDQVANKLMVEAHYYNPSQYTLLTSDASWGNMFYYWGSGYHSTTDPSRNPTWGEESDAPSEFSLMKSKFIDKGIPVILGEYGAIRRLQTLSGDALTLHLAGRAYYLNYVTHQALQYGLHPFYFDDGSTANNAFRIINRQTNGVADQQGLAAVMQGGQNGTSSTIQVGQVYQIFNRNSFKALEFAGWGTTNQTPADQWDYLAGANQQFMVQDAGGGNYRLTPMHATTKCLEVYGWSGSNGAQVDLWDYNGGNNQKWMIQPTDNGYYKIINVNSGKALDLYQLSLNNGGVVDQWDYAGNRNQQWGFVKR